jgi:hypothetical protein
MDSRWQKGRERALGGAERLREGGVALRWVVSLQRVSVCLIAVVALLIVGWIILVNELGYIR